MRKFPITKNRFISYFDIMGFKDYVYRCSHKEVSKLMDDVSVTVNAIKDAESQILKIPNSKRNEGTLDAKAVIPVIFSDSIVFISESDTQEDLRKILFVTSFFLYAMMVKSVPVKGAVSHGLFTADFQKSKFFGKPLIDAYLLAEEVQFYGSVIHNTAEIPLSKHTPALNNVKRDKVPMKGGMVTHYFSNWETMLDGKEDDERAEKLLEKFYTTVSGAVRKYVDNSISAYCASPNNVTNVAPVVIGVSDSND